MRRNKNLGIYIHVPFCKSKCYYCDFNSYTNKNELICDYFASLKKEALLYLKKLNSYDIGSVFIGGGTPSIVDANYIEDIMDFLKKNIIFSKEVEITIEANPESLSYTKLNLYKKSGINRISIGLQAWQDTLLKRIGRIHTKDKFIESFNMAKEVLTDNINVDLMFGIPGQSMEDWLETVTEVADLEPKHISCYSLKFEEGTDMHTNLSKGKITPIDEELDREMYYKATEILKQRGFNRYEISNFAIGQYESRHNILYWKTGEYIGFGAGAHSYFEGKRFNNKYNLEEYIQDIEMLAHTVQNVEKINLRGRISEFMILGLRLTEGISNFEFKDRFKKDMFSLFGSKIDNLVGKGLLYKENERIRLTTRGFDLANQVFLEFIL